MKTTYFGKHPATIILAALLAATAGGTNARAGWGSIRDNNHYDHGESSHVTVTEHRQMERAPAIRREVNVRREADVRRHVDVDFDGDRQRAHFWANYSAGMVVSTLPVGCVKVSARGTVYDYYQGVYYQWAPTGYTVVAPPIGALVTELPPGAVAVLAGNVTYYYAGGAYYQPDPKGFVVSPVPAGVAVSTLPPGALAVNVNGTIYYQADGVYYAPMMQGGVTMYTTVSL